MESKTLNSALEAKDIATDGAYILAQDAKGNTIRIAKADLASVLAASMGNPISYKKLLTTSDDLNSISDGIYWTANQNNPLNIPPEELYNNIIVQLSNITRGDGIQLLFSSNDQSCWVRFKNFSGWQSWKSITLG